MEDEAKLMELTRRIELRRHTANDGDVLTAEGVAQAVAIGRTLTGPYDLFVSSGAQRATQTAACLLAGWPGTVRGGVVVDEGFRSEREERWRAIYEGTRRPDLGSFLAVDEVFVAEEASRFVEALHRVLAQVGEGGRALVVGHSPMIEAAVWGATGHVPPPLDKGEALVLFWSEGAFRWEVP